MLSFTSYIKSILVEGIDEVAKYYPSLTKEQIQKLVSKDPTYAGGNELGKYGKWILQRANTVLKDQQRQEKWERGDKKFEAPVPKSPDKMSDLNDLKALLTKFEILAKTSKVKIDSLKSVKDLKNAVKEVKEADANVAKALALMDKSIDRGAKKVYESDKWMMIESQNENDNKVFGDDTKWCTTSTMYDHYIEKYGGKYLVCANKETGELYQLHFESDQYMDKNDKEIDWQRTFSNDSGLMKLLNKADAIAFEARVAKEIEYLKHDQHSRGEVSFEDEHVVIIRSRFAFFVFDMDNKKKWTLSTYSEDSKLDEIKGKLKDKYVNILKTKIHEFEQDEFKKSIENFKNWFPKLKTILKDDLFEIILGYGRGYVPTIGLFDLTNCDEYKVKVELGLFNIEHVIKPVSDKVNSKYMNIVKAEYRKIIKERIQDELQYIRKDSNRYFVIYNTETLNIAKYNKYNRFPTLSVADYDSCVLEEIQYNIKEGKDKLNDVKSIISPEHFKIVESCYKKAIEELKTKED